MASLASDAVKPNAKQQAENLVAHICDDVAARVRAAYPYLKSAVLDHMIKQVDAWSETIASEESAMAASQANSCFTDLPAEIRNRIYEFALISDKSIEVQNQVEYEHPDYYLAKATARPSLLSVNRQVRSEVLPVYYGTNTFTATFHSQWAGLFRTKITGGAVGAWCETIGKNQSEMISRLELRFPDSTARFIRHLLPYNGKRALCLRKDIRKRCIVETLGLDSSAVSETAISVFYDDDEPRWIELKN